MATITQRYVIDHVPSEVFSVRFSHDGLLLATGCNDGVVRVYNGKTGAPLHALSPNPKHRNTASLLFPSSSSSLSASLPTSGTNAGSGPSTSTLPTEEINEMEEEYDPERGFEAPPMPITALRFRPVTTNTNQRNILLTCSADGIIRHWHVPSARIISTIQETDNQIFAADYRNDALMFATGGKDKAVRIYDESRMDLTIHGNSSTVSSSSTSSSSSVPNKNIKPLLTMRGGGGYGSVSLLGGSSDDLASSMAGGHSNRIFGISWHPTDPHMLISGGWDNTIQFYDTRVGHAVRSIYGPHICGDALSFTPDGSRIITGSWRPDDVLQIWDYATGQNIMSVPWLRGNNEVSSYLHSVAGIAATQNGVRSSPLKATLNSTSNDNTSSVIMPPYIKADPCMLYSTTCSRNHSTVNTTVGNNNILIFAGGSGTNGGKIFRLHDLLALQTEIGSAKRCGSTTGTYALPLPDPNDSNNIHQCKPIVATISGLPRGVYGSDWDGNTGMVIVGGDQPIRVFDINPVGMVKDVGKGTKEKNSKDDTDLNTKGLIMTPPPKSKGSSKLRSRLPRGNDGTSSGSSGTTTIEASLPVVPPTSPDAGTMNTVSMIPPPPPNVEIENEGGVEISNKDASTVPSTETGTTNNYAADLASTLPLARPDAGKGEQEEEDDDDLDAVFGTKKGNGKNNENEDESEDEEENDIENGAVFDAGFTGSPNGRPTSAGRLGTIGSPTTKNTTIHPGGGASTVPTPSTKINPQQGRTSHAVRSLRNTVEQSRSSTMNNEGNEETTTHDSSNRIGIARTEPFEGITDQPLTAADEENLVHEYGGMESENVSDADSIETPADKGTTVTVKTSNNGKGSNIGATMNG